MNIEFSKNKLKKQLSSSTEIKRAFGERAKKVSARLDEIVSSPNLFVLMQIPPANCHPLTMDRKGEWALDISPNFRMIFEIVNSPIPKNEDGSINLHLVTAISILKIQDYH